MNLRSGRQLLVCQAAVRACVFAVLVLIATHGEAFARGIGSQECSVCHVLPSVGRTSSGHMLPLDETDAKRRSADEIREQFVKFLASRSAMMQRFDRSAVCRSVARLIAATLPTDGPCPDQFARPDNEVRARVTGHGSLDKDYQIEIIGISTRLVQADPNRVDILKILVALTYDLELKPSISVQIYSPTYVTGRSVPDTISNETVIPRQYAGKLSEIQFQLQGYLAESLGEPFN